MAIEVGRNARRLAGIVALKTVKGRRERGRFLFEGGVLLAEAQRSGTPIEEVYATQAAFETTPIVRDLDAAGTPTFLVDERTAGRLSDVEAPSGIVAVAPMRFAGLAEIVRDDGVVVVLADLNDPGNAGTLLRSADAFGALGIVCGGLGVDPYHPKVVRAAMGAVFRVRLARAQPPELAAAARSGGFTVLGLAPGGESIAAVVWPARTALIVGHERRGLGAWAALCERYVGIPMHAPSESLNAGTAGSIALYEAAKNRP
jgi:TrmH family RNA methyltransferase